MSKSKRNLYASSVYHSTGTAHHSRRRKKRNPFPFIVLAGILVIAAAAVIIIRMAGGSQDEDNQAAESSAGAAEIAEEISTDIIAHNAVIDLAEVLPGGEDLADDERYVYAQGKTPAEVSTAITDRYEWSLRVVNSDAEVGESVIQTVDANATTEAATMGDEDNPDGMNSDSEEESWDMTVADSIHVPDYIAAAIPALIQQVVDYDASYKEDKKLEGIVFELETEAETSETGKGFLSSLFGSGDKDETGDEAGGDGGEPGSETAEEPVYYVLSMGDVSEELAGIASQAATMWYVEAQGGSIGSYDKASDKFIMESSKAGYEVDEEALLASLTEAVSSRDYTAAIDVPGSTISAESSITVGDYKVIASYTTNTTSNSVRNKNIQLACEAVNGTILRPGEVFSFNDVVGQRTEEKGYGAAAAYNNGEVVQEVGGGVCQVSTTLYNAVVKAGLKTTVRQSHTFKPTYVTPGQDATISWGGPDYKFANTPAKAEYSNSSTYAIGIRASYYNQTCTVSIYGRPVLKSGYTYELSSEQIRELDLVRVQITPGDGREASSGSRGSEWETRLIIKKDGETISNAVDHKALYSGHTEYYYAETESETIEGETESGAEGESDGTAEGETDETQAETISESPAGPGGSSYSSSSGTNVIRPTVIDDGSDTADGPTAETTAASTSDGPSAGPGSTVTDTGTDSVVSAEGPGSL